MAAMMSFVARLATAGAIAASVLGIPARARPADEATSFFLSSGTPFDGGHVPLAVVRGAEVLDAAPRRRDGERRRSCGARTRWATVGSRWRALDEWGQVVAIRSVSRRSIYDVTRCAELTLSPGDDSKSHTLYVSEDSAWRASPSPAWTPSPSVQASFEALAHATIDDATAGRRAVQRECVGMSRTPADLRKRAPYYTCYRPVSIFDMNGDGAPEVVLFQSMGESWGDLVLGMGPDGTWRIVAISPGSAIV